MAQQNPITRLYDGSDAHMTESARVVYTLYLTDKVALSAFDSTLGTAFGNRFLADVGAAETVVADTAVEDQQAQLSETVVAGMEAARAKYGEVKYFVVKAFQDSPATQGEFGLNNYEAVRKSQPRMVQFLDEMQKAAAKYSSDLIAAGYDQDRIDEIADVRQGLLRSNTDQEVFKKQRPKLTEDRIAVLNKAYRNMTLVNAAAQIVFLADPAKRAQYVYDPSADKDDVAEYAGTVAAAEAKIVVMLADYDADRRISLRNTGTVPIAFYLTPGGTDAAGSVVEIGGGATILRTMQEMNGDKAATSLVVKNLKSGDEEGMYEVEIDLED